MENIVSTVWLNKHLNDEHIILLDTRLQTTAEGTISDLQNRTIPTARYLDLKQHFSDTTNPLPATFPTEQQFEREARALGINHDSIIIVFDDLGIHSSARVWWMFKAMGHQKVAVLNGGLPEWIQHGFQTVQRQIQKSYSKGDFRASFIQSQVKNYQDVFNNLQHPTFTVVDARSKERFEGVKPEPRKGIKSGHIPNSVNLPYTHVLTNGKLKSKEELTLLFQNISPIHSTIVFSCGSGITACIVLLAYEITIGGNSSIYDGSWTEWAEQYG